MSCDAMLAAPLSCGSVRVLQTRAYYAARLGSSRLKELIAESALKEGYSEDRDVM